MCGKIFGLISLVFVICTGDTARAEYITYVYTGFVTTGFDTAGVFGSQKTDLSGKSFKAVEVFDLSKQLGKSPLVIGGSGYGLDVSVTAELTINDHKVSVYDYSDFISNSLGHYHTSFVGTLVSQPYTYSGLAFNILGGNIPEDIRTQFFDASVDVG